MHFPSASMRKSIVHLSFWLSSTTPQAFNLWREALSQLTPGGRCNPELGLFLHPPHTTWQSSYDPTNDVVITVGNNGLSQFWRQGTTRRVRNAPYKREGTIMTDTSTFNLCSARSLIPPPALHHSTNISMIIYCPGPIINGGRT